MAELPLSRLSERVPATGMIDGDAARRALGKPDLSFWEVFLRETLQNSWDARLGVSIDFEISARRLDEPALTELREHVFADALPFSVVDDIGDYLDSADPYALIVRDRGTRGLAGPARSDLAVDVETRTDFRSFVFDIGRDQRRTLGGGTYGFGKGVLYAASRIRTCLVYTRTEFGGATHDRFIATRVGSSFEHENHRYTGRHWWGQLQGGAVLPLEGHTAVQLAHALSMSIPEGETGTTIAVLAPHEPGTDTDQFDEIMEAIRKAALIWAWPHLADPSGSPSIRFDFSLDGSDVPVSLESDPEVQQFAAAYREALQHETDPSSELSWQVTVNRLPLDATRPKTGVLAVRRTVQAASISRTLDSRVALMRAPRFVVKYVRIDPDPHDQYTAGVFIVDSEMDQTFAKAEPVTHDNWAREASRSKSRPVAWTLDDIRRATTTQVDLPGGEGETANLSGVAQLARVLGEQLIGVTGRGAEMQVARPRGTRLRSDLVIRLGGEPQPVAIEGTRFVVDFPVTVRQRSGADLSQWVVTAEPRVVAEAGGLDGSFIPADTAEVLGWIVDGAAVEGSTVRGNQLVSDVVMLRVAHDHDVAVTASFRKERVQ